MSRLPLFLILVSILGCANTEYRFERINGSQPMTLPFKFDGIHGIRDGASVKAEARFSDGVDVLTMNIALHLVPPPEFVAGTYEGNIGGKATAGRVECVSLTYLGGQADVPSVGGLFILKDQQDRPV